MRWPWDKLTSSQWAKLAKCSQETAHRDIVDLVKRGILAKDAAGGRSQATRSPNRPARPDQGNDCLDDAGSKGKERSRLRRPGTSFGLYQLTPW